MPEISKQNVIVTGGARGIGRAIVEKFVAEGANIAILDLDRDSIEQTIDEIEEKIKPSGELSALEADVSDPDSVDEAISGWVDENETVHTLVNNAGITRDGLLMRQKFEDWKSVLEVNLDGAYNCTKSVIRPMMRNRWGRIIMISSVIGLRGNAGQTNYAASKAGVIGFCKSVAQELGSRSITCNAVAPGFIRTEMTEELPDKVKDDVLSSTPAGRLGEPAEVADCVLFLAGEQSGFITGEVIRVDGGMAM